MISWFAMSVCGCDSQCRVATSFAAMALAVHVRSRPCLNAQYAVRPYFVAPLHLFPHCHVTLMLQAFSEINLTMKTFPYLTRLPVFCPWPTAAPTLTVASSSSRAQKQTGEFSTLYFALVYAPLVIRFIRLDNKHVVFGKVIDGMLTVRLRCHKELFVSV